MFYKPGQKHLGPADRGRADAQRGYPASHNPYLSPVMKAEWLAGWNSQQLCLKNVASPLAEQKL